MAAARELVGSGTVLETPEGPPRLCLGYVLASRPPAGGTGPVLVGWDWSAVSGHESVSGTTWGSYTVVGTYDGDTFTLTREPVPAAGTDSSAAGTGQPQQWLRTPCPEPAGGWQVLDPALVDDDALQRSIAAAQGLDEFADLWLDHSVSQGGSQDDRAGRPDDPSRVILNVAVAGSAAPVEAELRRTWGGALCVSRAPHSRAALARVRDELLSTPGLLEVGWARAALHLHVVHDDGTLQRELDATYGRGVAVVTSALRAYRPRPLG